MTKELKGRYKMKEELKGKYESYLVLRKGRTIRSFLLIFAVFWLALAWIFLMIFIGLMGLAVWAVITIFLIIIAKKYPSPPIQPRENEMFLKTCDTLRNIEFYLGDLTSEIHLERARKKLGELISVIRSIEMERTTYSMIIEKAISEPLERLSSNLEKRMLPLIRYPSNSKDVQKAYSRLESLAFIFIEPITIAQNLSLCNEILEEIPEPKEITPPHGFRNRLSLLFSAHKIVRDGLVVSIIFIGCCVFCYIVVSHFEIQREYALGVGVASFLGLLTIYFRRQPTE